MTMTMTSDRFSLPEDNYKRGAAMMSMESYDDLKTQMRGLLNRAQWGEAEKLATQLYAAARRGKRSTLEALELAAEAEAMAGAEAAAAAVEIITPPRRMPHPSGPVFEPGSLERREAVRAEQNGIEIGQTFTKVKKGQTVSVTWVGARAWTTGGKTFTSISDAANHASGSVGGVDHGLNGWKFWGIEKQEGDK